MMRIRSNKTVLSFLPLSAMMLAVGPLAAGVDVDVRPLAARPGDTFTLVVTTQNCPAQNDGLWVDSSVTISGGEVTLSKTPQVANCSISYSATVADKPVSRQLKLVLTDKDKKTVATREFNIVDIPPGPIPPGLDPQVDVMFDIMSPKNCSDQFGLRLSRRYFCIDVVLGNNSGYPLLLAGVGFLRHAGAGFEFRESAASYLSTRAVVQREQVVSGRNVTLRALQAAGLIIGASSPFSSLTGRQGRINLWSSIIGTTLAAAWDGLVPDRTVKQAGNLDDAALRDGKVIPNNSPARFSVFVDRDSLKPILLMNASELAASAAVFDAKGQQLEQEAAQTNDPPTRAVKTAGARLARAEAASEKEIAAKQSRGQQELKKKNPMGRSRAKLEDDLIAVRRALGPLIIVGDQIEFRQRIQVDSSAVNPEIQTPAPPAIFDITTNPAAPVKDTAFSFTLNGANFDPNAVVVTFTGPGCTSGCAAKLTTKTAIQLTGSITLSTDGTFTVTVQNGANGKPFGNASVVVKAAATP